MSKKRRSGTSQEITSPLKWHGGKHYLAKKIVALMPKHLHYVEPYAGGLSVLLAKDPEGVSEVVNDLDQYLTQFWMMLQHPQRFELFRCHMETTPFSETEWLYSWSTLQQGWSQESNGDKLATAFFICCRQSLAGRMKSFAPLSKTRTRRGMNEQVSAWLSAVEGLPEVHNRLKRVVILNRDALDIIREQDGKDTLVYADPTYLHETRSTKEDYHFEMTELDHRALLLELATLKGKFLLSGYRSKLYDKQASFSGWNRYEFSLPNNAAGGKSKRRMIECVWTNF